MSESESIIDRFNIEGEQTPVSFVETVPVSEGIECDIYAFEDDATKDLGIIRVTKGLKTPLQRVLLGVKTIEGYVSGEGTLTVESTDGVKDTYEFKPDEPNKPVTVNVGELMQWHANGETDLTFYEICEPPYQEGRFEDLPEV